MHTSMWFSRHTRNAASRRVFNFQEFQKQQLFWVMFRAENKWTQKCRVSPPTHVKSAEIGEKHMKREPGADGNGCIDNIRVWRASKPLQKNSKEAGFQPTVIEVRNAVFRRHVDRKGDEAGEGEGEEVSSEIIRSSPSRQEQTSWELRSVLSSTSADYEWVCVWQRQRKQEKNSATVNNISSI
jgi:hypothetical protein